jgi:hypothetical protein
MADHLGDIVEHEKHARRSLWPFAVLVVAVVVLWLMFASYL